MHEELNGKTKKFIHRYINSLPCWGVITLFFNNPQTYGRVEDFVKWTGLNTNLVSNTLKTLTKKGLLVYEEHNKCYSYNPKKNIEKQLTEFFHRYEPSVQRFYILEHELEKSHSEDRLT